MISVIRILDPPLVTIHTLVCQGFLLPFVRSLLTLRTSLFNRISQIINFRTKVDRIVHLVLDRWAFPHYSKNVWGRVECLDPQVMSD